MPAARSTASALLSAVALGAVLAAGLAACTPEQQARPAPPPPPPATVTVAKPEVRTVTEREEYVGRFVATDTVEMRARVSGYLGSVNFRDGQRVNKGDLLFVIDKRPYEATLDQAQADIARAHARLDSAAADLSRSERLIKDRSISEQVYDQRVAAKRDADAQLEAAEAALRRAQLDLEFTELRAPVTGRIGDRRVAPGNLVTGGTQGNTTLLATIVSLDPIFFEFTMDEATHLRFARLQRSAGKNRDGLPVELKLLDEDTFTHQGVVEFVDNVLDQSSGTIRMRARFENASDLFTPGMFGRIRMAASQPYEALLIPEVAVVSDQSRKMVLTVTPDNTVAPRPVTLGPAFDGMRVVRSGLKPDDMVIVNGLMKARPGAKVNPVPAGAPPAAPGAPVGQAPSASQPRS
ncbi:efflux RND transporter periplasmic adaptor subunit [Alsobacter sp. R-9]